ncbi:MAG: hypothetical protein ACREQN_11400 [Candidatus Binataceae bacterium]
MPSQTIRGVLGKFAGLPREAEDEIRELDPARRRIVELEREIKRLMGTSTTAQIDPSVVERAVRSALERERAEWRRKLEQGRAHFWKMIGATSSVGQAVEKLKVSLQNVESGWANPVVETPGVSFNYRPERAPKSGNHRPTPAETLDGPLKTRFRRAPDSHYAGAIPRG